MEAEVRVVLLPVFCGKDCGGNACPLLATVENGQVVRIGNNPEAGPHLKGCRRGFGLGRERNAPGRLLKPLIRTGERGSGQFREAGWDEALTFVAARLGEVRAQHGPFSVLNLASAGSTGALHGTIPLLSRFLNLSGGATALKGSYSIAAAHFVLPYLFGPAWKPSTGVDPATMRHSRMILLWGANVLETRHGAAVTPHLLEAKARGAEIVVIDPRRTATMARAGTWWLPVRPGTDAALMLAVLHVLLAEGLADRAFIASHAVGFDELERYARDCTPAWAESRCGVPAAEIVRFARTYAAAKPALLLPGYSIQRVFAGEETFRLAAALQLATGNLGRLGGSTGAPISRLPTPRVGTLPVPPVPDQPILPINDWPDAALGDGIKALYSVGGNLLNQGGDVAKNIRAFRSVDFAVCHDLFLTPTARHCDVVLPAAHTLEREDIGIPWLGNYLTYAPQVLPVRGLARTDYDILAELADRLGFGVTFTEGRSPAQWIQHFLDASEIPDHEAFRRTGVYVAPDQERVGLAAFAADPVAHPLGTPSGRVEIGSAAYAKATGFPAIPQWREPLQDPRFPLRLVTPKVGERTHSQTHGEPVADHALIMHPDDAAERGLPDGAPVRVASACGHTRTTLQHDAGLMRSVVSLPEGIWADLDADGLDRAGSANALTGTEGTRPSRACVMSGVPVEVGPAE